MSRNITQMQATNRTVATTVQAFQQHQQTTSANHSSLLQQLINTKANMTTPAFNRIAQDHANLTAAFATKLQRTCSAMAQLVNAITTLTATIQPPPISSTSNSTNSSFPTPLQHLPMAAPTANLLGLTLSVTPPPPVTTLHPPPLSSITFPAVSS